MLTLKMHHMLECCIGRRGIGGSEGRSRSSMREEGAEGAQEGSSNSEQMQAKGRGAHEGQDTTTADRRGAKQRHEHRGKRAATGGAVILNNVNRSICVTPCICSSTRSAPRGWCAKPPRLVDISLCSACLRRGESGRAGGLAPRQSYPRAIALGHAPCCCSRCRRRRRWTPRSSRTTKMTKWSLGCRWPSDALRRAACLRCDDDHLRGPDLDPRSFLRSWTWPPSQRPPIQAAAGTPDNPRLPLCSPRATPRGCECPRDRDAQKIAL